MPESLLMSAAPAKINLSLEVLGRRPDGYHELDTIVQTLTLADRLNLDLSKRNVIIHVIKPAG